ncbi:hypothetical protein D3C81_1233040 [compost metagenome]
MPAHRRTLRQGGRGANGQRQPVELARQPVCGQRLQPGLAHQLGVQQWQLAAQLCAVGQHGRGHHHGSRGRWALGADAAGIRRAIEPCQQAGRASGSGRAARQHGGIGRQRQHQYQHHRRRGARWRGQQPGQERARAVYHLERPQRRLPAAGGPGADGQRRPGARRVRGGTGRQRPRWRADPGPHRGGCASGGDGPRAPDGGAASAVGQAGHGQPAARVFGQRAAEGLCRVRVRQRRQRRARRRHHGRRLAQPLCQGILCVASGQARVPRHGRLAPGPAQLQLRQRGRLAQWYF